MEKILMEEIFDLEYFSPNEFEAYYELIDYLGIKIAIDPLKLYKSFKYLLKKEKYYLLEQLYISYHDLKLIKFFSECLSKLFGLDDSDIFYTYCINKLCKDHILVKYNSKKWNGNYSLLTWNNGMVQMDIKYIDHKIYVNAIDFYDYSYKYTIFNRSSSYGYCLFIFNKKFLNKKGTNRHMDDYYNLDSDNIVEFNKKCKERFQI